MSIRSEIRAALVDGPKTTDELLPLVASVEGDRKRLGNHMGNLAAEQMVRRAGLAEDGKPLYQLEPKMWPAREEGAAPPPKATKPAPATKAAEKAPPAAPKKSQRTAAKVQRKTAISRTPAITRALTVGSTPDWRVGLQVDGSVFAFDPSAGTHQVIDAAIVRQILGMATLLRPAA